MVPIIQNAFRKNLLMLRVLGLYPPDQYQHLYKTYAITLYMTCTIPSPVLAIIFLIISDEVDLLKIADNMFLTAQVGMFIFKLIPFIWNAPEIRRSLKFLESDIFLKFSQEHPQIADDCAKSCRQIFWFFSICCWATLFTWGMRPVFTHIRKLPVDVWLPFDAFINNTRYVVCYICVYVGVGHGAISNGALDPLVAGLVCQAAGQFRMLKYNLEHLSDYVDDQIKTCSNGEQQQHELRSTILYERICQCIEHHNTTLSYVSHYENTYSFAVFCQFISSAFVICVSTYVLTTTTPFSFSFFGMILYIITMLSEIFLYSYYGTILYDESNSLITSVYMGNWYEYDLKSKKALILLMERSKRPVRMTAGKILDLSLETFATVLRRAYSLFAVLNSFNE